MKLFKNIKNSFDVNVTPAEDSEPKELTRGALANKIFAKFMTKMGEETDEYQLLFPSSFTIYLTTPDFNRRKSGFPFTVKELVNRFNKAVLEEKKTNHPDYVAHSKFWFFKFTCFPDEGSVNLDGRIVTSLAEGDVLVQCDLVPEDEAEVSKQSAGRRVTTVVNETPVIPTGAINTKAVKGVTTKPGYTYIVEFADFEDLTNETFAEDTVKDDGKAPEKPAFFGCLKVLYGEPFLVDGRRVNEFDVATPELYISGIHDATSISGIPVLHLATDEVVSTHVHLTVVSPGVFKLQANGPVWASGVQLDASSTETVEVRPGSKIVIGDEISVVQVK